MTDPSFLEHLSKIGKIGDFPAGPVVLTSSCNERGAGFDPGWGAEIPQSSGPKKPKHKAEAIYM